MIRASCNPSPSSPHHRGGVGAAPFSRRLLVESWRKAFRDGIAPSLSNAALEALATALELDDPRLIQGATTVPSPLPAVSSWPVEGACALGFAGWQGEQLETVGAVEDYFCKMCMDVDFTFGEPAAVRWLLNFFDE